MIFLAKDDTYAELSDRAYWGERPGTNELAIGQKHLINGSEFIVKDISKNPATGFYAAVFEGPTGEHIMAIRGSFNVKKVFDAEWVKDWLFNNAVTGTDHLPPQFDDLLRFLDTTPYTDLSPELGTVQK